MPRWFPVLRLLREVSDVAQVTAPSATLGTWRLRSDAGAALENIERLARNSRLTDECRAIVPDDVVRRMPGGVSPPIHDVRTSVAVIRLRNGRATLCFALTQKRGALAVRCTVLRHSTESALIAMGRRALDRWLPERRRSVERRFLDAFVSSVIERGAHAADA